ncbi:MAG: LysR family transcriptional regulator [Clostridiaceae bacterium]|nr:LysR family transcriptional regulator [Clostridiaceae bacterium]
MFDELKTFITVVDCKNFTKAAKKLNLSQPSVSTHIKNLENYFDVTLINRSVKQKRIFITESGHILYKRAKEMLNLLDITYIAVHDSTDTVKGHIKIGASLTIGECILPKFLSIFSKKYPDIDIEVVIENTATISAEIKNLTLDIGLIEGSISSSQLNQNFLLKDKMTLACPYNPHLKEFDYDYLDNQKWLIREDGSGTREYLNMFLFLHQITPKNVVVLGSNYAIKEAVKNGLGITIISKLVVDEAVKNKEITLLNLDNKFERYFSYITPKNITLSKASEIFISELKEYCKLEIDNLINS